MIGIVARIGHNVLLCGIALVSILVCLRFA
jgi:hypothetical protein